MTTGDVVYSLRFSLIKILPEPGFDLGSTAGESCVLTARLHMLYCELHRIIEMINFHANANMLRFSKCSIPVKCYLFKTYSNLYCTTLWYNFTLTAMKRIKNAYNNSIRMSFFLPKHNSASEMCVNLNLMSFRELLRKYVYSFRFRLGVSLSCIIDNIYISNVPLHFIIWAWWHSCLTV